MNAKELLADMERSIKEGEFAPSEIEDANTLLRALRLLAAAENNDGSTPECRAEQELYANSNGEHAAWELAERFERQRTGLAARVAVLEEEAAQWDSMIAAQERSVSNERQPKMATEFVRELANMVQRDGALLPRMQIASHYRSLASALDENAKLAARVLELEGERDSATAEALYGYKEMHDEVMKARGLLHECAMALRDDPMSKRAFSKDRLLAAIDAARSK